MDSTNMLSDLKKKKNLGSFVNTVGIVPCTGIYKNVNYRQHLTPFVPNDSDKH